ncbi:MAG: hypothetical protein NZ992_03030 [Candidatus Korarchaeum sp.]|nr:hypothetical protein [Candidatus Korarchaeum sp.]MDW8035065.1 hypothetical protein [Candidatus Korarchaeum sp.]
MRSVRRRVRKRYKTHFFFDRTVPRDFYFSIQRRLNYLGYGAVWQPRSAVKGKDRDLRELLEYCVKRGIRIFITFSKFLEIPEEYRSEIKLVRLKGGKRKTVNRVIARLFLELRCGKNLYAGATCSSKGGSSEC